MTTIQSTQLTYAEIRVRMRTHHLRQYEIPLEHGVSIPLPTLRCGRAGYAFFASPTLRQPEQPVEQAAPDRWWVLDAVGGNTLVYALYSVIPFAPDAQYATARMAKPDGTMDALLEMVADIDQYATALAPAFFAGEPGDPADRGVLRENLTRFIPAEIIPQYRGLAPDFFAWLEG